LLDKNLSVIHLDDKNIPFSDIKNLYVIQGTTCFLKNELPDNILYYDPRFSSDNKNFSKKCFAYSVTVDRKYFQL
jgi:hypothetical protein